MLVTKSVVSIAEMHAFVVPQSAVRRSSSAQSRETRKSVAWLSELSSASIQGGALCTSTSLNAQRTARATGAIESHRSASPSEDPRETIQQLQRRIDALRLELSECSWATQRAAELGAALDVLSKENAQLRDECARQRSRADELESLRQAQQVLLAMVDGGGISPRRLQALLAQSPSIQESCAELQNACRAVATWGPSVCPACLQAREDRCRLELVMKERTSRQMLESQWEAMFAARRYCSLQLSDVEVERMWQEDILAHRLANAHLQHEVNKLKAELIQVPRLEALVEHLKHKCRGLSEASARTLHTVEEGHKKELAEARNAAQRPNVHLLRFLFVSNLKTFYQHGKLLFALNVLRKHAHMLRAELHMCAEELVAELRDVQEFCVRACRRMMPPEWAPVLPTTNDVTARGKLSVHPPVLSTYARHAVVRSASSPARKK